MTIATPGMRIDMSDPVACARALYTELSQSLLRRVQRLREEPDGPADPKGCEDLVKAHYKAVQTALDYEVTLGKRAGREANGTDGTVALDLDAARAEIRRRIARLAGGA
ncbi:MAG: hypothetical protein AAGE18_11270 [Pseudomonadota bacterium]